MSRTPIQPMLPSGLPPGDYFTRLHAAINTLYSALRSRIEGLVVDSPTVTFDVVTAVDFAGSKIKTRTITVTEGIITSVGTESGWT